MAVRRSSSSRRTRPGTQPSVRWLWPHRRRASHLGTLSGLPLCVVCFTLHYPFCLFSLKLKTSPLTRLTMRLIWWSFEASISSESSLQGSPIWFRFCL